VRRFLVYSAILACAGCVSVEPIGAQEFANIEYLCADWGPAMSLPSKPGEKPQFSDTEEEIYFLKQVTSFTRKKHLVPDLLSGNTTEDIGHGISIYLCKMKSDGSGKTDIKELWKNPNYPIDTKDYSCWMNVNKKTHKIALSILFTGSDVAGLWTMNLDGGDLKRIITPTLIEGHLQAIDSPSWTPDGQWIVFAESLRGAGRGRIAKCDMNGGNPVYFTEGPGDCQSRVSPDGNMIAYVHIGDAITGGLCLMGIDGTNPHLLQNPDDKRRRNHGGIYPTWSPDGKRLLIIGSGIEVIEVATGRRVLSREPVLQGKRGTCGIPQWGRVGFVGSTPVGGILFTDSNLERANWIGSSKLLECAGAKGSCQW